MNGCTTCTAEQDGLALILTALRKDHDALGGLLAAIPPDALPHAAAFAVTFAADLCLLLEQAAPGTVHTALQRLALDVADPRQAAAHVGHPVEG
jgi:hypothetical protein